MTIEERKKLVADKSLCIICLHKHDNKPCRSKYKCRHCQGDHNTKLHEFPSTNIIYATNQTEIEYEKNETKTKLLATAIVKVKDKFGANHLLRVFIDQGSDGALITERAVQLLCLARKNENIPLTGLNDIPLGKSSSSVQIQVESAIYNPFKMELRA